MKNINNKLSSVIMGHPLCTKMMIEYYLLFEVKTTLLECQIDLKLLQKDSVLNPISIDI